MKLLDFVPAAPVATPQPSADDVRSAGWMSAGLWLAAALAAPVAGQVTERVSVDSLGTQGNGASSSPSVSPDGRYVAFWSAATNLVSGDTNGWPDIFVRDRWSGTVARASVSSGGAQTNEMSGDPSISADGRYVAFWSSATNLVSGDTNPGPDIFVRDRWSGTTERVSVDSSGAQGNGASVAPSISADDRYVAFQSTSTNLVSGDTNGFIEDIFVRDRWSGTTELVSVDTLGTVGNDESLAPSISADGRYVVFESKASNFVSGDSAYWDIFVRDRLNGTTERVSIDAFGFDVDVHSFGPSISADGRYVAFYSEASDIVSGDTNGWSDVFVRDRQNGTNERVSVASGGAQANHASVRSSISGDGRYVAFVSNATNLVSGDTNGWLDIFVRDRLSGTTERVSVASGGTQANGHSGLFEPPSISGDGLYVAFASEATNLVGGDTNGVRDLFVHRRGPAPTVTSVGSSCAAPTLTWSGSPSLGGTYAVMIANLGPDNGVLLVDWSNLTGGFRPVRRLGVPCPVWVVPDVTYAIPGSTPIHVFNLPNDPALLGVHLRTQALVLSSPTTTTQVLDALIGLP